MEPPRKRRDRGETAVYIGEEGSLAHVAIGASIHDAVLQYVLQYVLLSTFYLIPSLVDLFRVASVRALLRSSAPLHSEGGQVLCRCCLESVAGFILTKRSKKQFS